MFNNVPDEAHKFDGRRLTLFAQLVSDEWNSSGDDAKRSRFDLVRVYRPSTSVEWGEGKEKKRTLVSSDANITRLAAKNSLAETTFMMHSMAV